MYAQTALKRRRAVKSCTEIERGEGTLDMKQGGIVDDSYPVSFRSSSSEARTGRSKQVRYIAHLSSMYEVAFRISMREYERNDKEDQTGKMDFVLVRTRSTYEGMETMIIRSPTCLVRKM